MNVIVNDTELIFNNINTENIYAIVSNNILYKIIKRPDSITIIE